MIRKRIEEISPGEPFTPADFLGCASRASIDQTLSRLVKVGVIERAARGVFVRPEVNRFVGKVAPTPMKIAEAIAKASGATIQVHGAEAARRFGLTTQTPAQPVFSTSGPSRRIRIGSMEIRLRRVSPRKLALAGSPAGLALAALWHLGEKEVTPSVIDTIRQKLSATEFEALKSITHLMPAWMSDVIFRAERDYRHG